MAPAIGLSPPRSKASNVAGGQPRLAPRAARFLRPRGTFGSNSRAPPSELRPRQPGGRGLDMQNATPSLRPTELTCKPGSRGSKKKSALIRNWGGRSGLYPHARLCGNTARPRPRIPSKSRSIQAVEGLGSAWVPSAPVPIQFPDSRIILSSHFSPFPCLTPLATRARVMALIDSTA